MHDLVAADAEPFGRVEGGRELARINVARAHVTAAATGANRLEPLERLLDRCAVIGRVGEEELDTVDTKSLQAARELLVEKGGVEAAAFVLGGNLGRETNSVSDRGVALDEPTADHGLAGTAGVALRGVEQCDAQTNRFVHRRERRRLVQPTPHEFRTPADPA